MQVKKMHYKEVLKIIETNRLKLRELRKGDEENIVNRIGSINVARYLQVVPHPYNLSDAEWFVNKQIKEREKGQREEFTFGITQKEQDQVIGCIGLSKIDLEQKQATLGYWLGQDFWGQGIMTEAAKEVIAFGFSELGLKRINVEAVVENQGSNRVIKKLGFVFEGVKRKGMISKATGEVHDVNKYGLLRDEWE